MPAAGHGLGGADQVLLEAAGHEHREVVELNPQVVEVCRNWFCLPPDDDRLTVHVQDAAKFVQDSNRHGRYRAISVDLYDHDAAAPVLDHAGSTPIARRCSKPGGVMTVNVFGWASHYGSSVTAIGEGFGVPTGEAWMYSLKPTKEGNTVIMVVSVRRRRGRATDRASLLARPKQVKEAFELPAEKWVRCSGAWKSNGSTRPKTSKPEPAAPALAGLGGRGALSWHAASPNRLSRVFPHVPPSSPVCPEAPVGCLGAACARLRQGQLHWRWVVDGLSADGLLDEPNRRMVEGRLAAGDSAQHPFQRIGGIRVVSARMAALDVDALTAWLAERAQMGVIHRSAEIRPRPRRRRDVPFAERCKALPVQVGAQEVVVATSKPFDTGWVPEIEAHTKRRVKLMVANPWTCSASPPSSTCSPAR